MKENEFLDAVTAIDTDVVRRFVTMDQHLAENAKPPRRKAFLPIASLAACLVLIVGAVILVPRLYEEAHVESSAEATSHAESGYDARPTQYVIYCHPSAGDLNTQETVSHQVSFENVGTKDFSFATKTEVERPSGTPDEQTIELNGKLYSGRYSGTYETAIAASHLFGSYGRFHTYRNDMGYMDFRASDNKLMLFVNFDEETNTAHGTVTEEEAKSIAGSVLLSVYGENAFEEYAYDTTLYTESPLGVYYTMVYRKHVCGMPTQDAVSISVNRRGEIVGINAKYLGMFSLAEAKLTKQDIDDAIAVLRETFAEKWTILTTRLVLDTEGHCYISAQLARTGSEGMEAETVYITVGKTQS